MAYTWLTDFVINVGRNSVPSIKWIILIVKLCCSLRNTLNSRQPIKQKGNVKFLLSLPIPFALKRTWNNLLYIHTYRSSSQCTLSDSTIIFICVFTYSSLSISFPTHKISMAWPVVAFNNSLTHAGTTKFLWVQFHISKKKANRKQTLPKRMLRLLCVVTVRKPSSSLSMSKVSFLIDRCSGAGNGILALMGRVQEREKEWEKRNVYGFFVCIY